MDSNSALIAVVDDDPVLVEAVAQLIRSLGHRASTFTSAADLLAADPARFQCVVSDVKMPVMGGLGLLSALRRDHSAVPVILITAYIEEVRRTEAVAAGAICILPKPFDDQDLERCLNLALSRERTKPLAR